MHAIIELLPIVLGFLIARLYDFKKVRSFRIPLLFTLTIIAGLITNRLSREGLEFLFIDILTTGLSTFAFILIIKYLRPFLIRL